MQSKKRRTGLAVMAGLIGMIKPLLGYMVIAVAMGCAGNLMATFITILGGYGFLGVIGAIKTVKLTFIFVLLILFAVFVGFYVMQSRRVTILLRLSCWHVSVIRYLQHFVSLHLQN